VEIRKYQQKITRYEIDMIWCETKYKWLESHQTKFGISCIMESNTKILCCSSFYSSNPLFPVVGTLCLENYGRIPSYAFIWFFKTIY